MHKNLLSSKTLNNITIKILRNDNIMLNSMVLKTKHQYKRQYNILGHKHHMHMDFYP